MNEIFLYIALQKLQTVGVCNSFGQLQECSEVLDAKDRFIVTIVEIVLWLLIRWEIGSFWIASLKLRPTDIVR
jgi:hypothetical protein